VSSSLSALLRAACWLSGGSCGLLLCTQISAQDLTLPAARTVVMSADPNAPDTSLVWRGSLRGTVSGNVPIVGAPFESPVSVNVLPLIEIHNDPGETSPLPSQNWRGRLSLYAAWTWHYATMLQAGIEHESDHYTARAEVADAFIELNDFFFTGSHIWATEDWALTLRASTQLFVWSCTEESTPCRDFQGATTIGGSLGAVWDFRGQDPHGVAPFLAVDAGGILANDETLGEGRIVLHAGLWTTGSRGDVWQLYGLGWVGNDVGITRPERLLQAGLGIRYAR
jgi:hypothetical protein